MAAVNPSSPDFRAIVRDGAGQLYSVRNAGPGLDHVWHGIPCKRDGVPKVRAVERLVRRFGCTVVQEIADGPRA